MTSRMVTLLTTLAAATSLLSSIGERPVPGFVWNASDSVPIGLYRLRPAGKLAITELVAVRPPEPTATFLADGNY
ncbi:MAG: S26 family signal peptidase, partial [Bradyrhizobium sp.]